MMPAHRIPAELRLEANSMPEPNTGCQIWLGTLDRKDQWDVACRGMIWYKGRFEGVHRVAFKVKKGPIPDGMRVLHKCDTGLCINENHLYAGTPLDNMQDKMKRGRWRGGRKKAV